MTGSAVVYDTPRHAGVRRFGDADGEVRIGRALLKATVLSPLRGGRVFERIVGPVRRWPSIFSRATPLSLGILLILVALGGWAPALSAQPSPATHVRIMAPFEPGKLVSGLTVSARDSGSCWTASLASGSRSDAWRCIAGNRIHDPCFVGFIGAEQVAACPPSPWSSEVVLLSLTAPLPGGDVNRSKSPLEGPPWALELASGERCTVLTGATWAVAGLRVNYGCPDGVFVVGKVDRSLPTWRAFVLRGGTAVMSQEEIRSAYY